MKIEEGIMNKEANLHSAPQHGEQDVEKTLRADSPRINSDIEKASYTEKGENRAVDMPTILHLTTSTNKKNKDKIVDIISAGDTVFVLKGNKYKALKNISDSSGEAQVFLVERKEKTYVLKLYYLNYKFKEDLLRLIWNLDFEMIVKLYDFGSAYVNGHERDYELMEYLEGGTLCDYKLQGNFKKFKNITLQAAAALSYCHTNQIIHKDIKPGNFFFRDKEHTQLVLGDFGISSMVSEEEEMHRTTQARTPLYAAPEMYDDVIDGEVEITNKVDFYSLGITLLYLWIGKNPFSKNERMMIRMKQEGKIPYIGDLPPRVAMVIKGLTSLNPNKRWGYEEVERWFKGEEVPIDTSSAFLRYKTFVMDPEHNLAAQDVKELVPLLYDNKELAIRYLYGKRISQWLDDCGNSKMTVLLNDIIEHRYPVNQTAGWMSAIYTLEPQFPFYDIKGNSCSDIHAVTLSLLAHAQEYTVLLKDQYHPLFLYLERRTEVNIERVREYFKEDASVRSIWKLIYEMDSSVPFLNHEPSSTIKEIVRAYGTGNCSEDEWHALTDGRLLAWMYSHCDAALCESMRILTSGRAYSRNLAYAVFYNIDRSAAYDLREAYTEEQVAILLKEALLKNQHQNDDNFVQSLADFLEQNGRLYIYAQLHKWNRTIMFMQRCLNINSKENKERLGMYDIRTAAYKLCAAMGGQPSYWIEAENIEVNDISSLQSIDPKVVRNEIRNGTIAKWISIFYHENPFFDCTQSFGYERKLEEFLKVLGEFDHGEIHYKRYLIAQEQMEQKITEARNAWNKSVQRKHIWQLFFASLSAIWLGLLLFLGISNSSALASFIYYAVCVPVGLSAFIMGWVLSYFRGNGVTINLFFAILAALSSFIPAFILEMIWRVFPFLFNSAVVFLSLLYIVVAFLLSKKNSNQHLGELRAVFQVDPEKALVEKLYYTFKIRSFKFKGSNFSLLDDAVSEVKSFSSEKILRYALWSLMLLLLIFIFVWYHPVLLDNPLPNILEWKTKYWTFIHQLKAIE